MKKLIKSGVIMLVVATLVAANYFAVYWFTPYPRYIAWNKTPAESQEYFDYPDQILFYYKGRTRVLRSEESISEAYDAFWKVLGNEIVEITSYPMMKMPYTDKVITGFRKTSVSIVVEFRYEQRRVYSTNTQNRKIEYDAAMVIIPTAPVPQESKYPDRALSCYSLNGTYSLSGVGPNLEVVGENISDFVNYVQSLYG